MILAEMAIEIGVTRLILLDVARVGTSSGTGTIELVKALHRTHPTVELIAGGGISGLDDLLALQHAGASAVLVASALHDGRLGLESTDCESADSP